MVCAQINRDVLFTIYRTYWHMMNPKEKEECVGGGGVQVVISCYAGWWGNCLSYDVEKGEVLLFLL